MPKKVTILGAGNAGHAIAFDLSNNGAEVTLYEHPDFAKSLEGIRQKGGIEAVKSVMLDGQESQAAASGFAKIAHLTINPKEAMEFSDVVVMVVPAFGQEAIFKSMLPHIRENQIFVMLPGNFASLVFKRIMREAGINKKVTFVEGPSIPYAVRVIGLGQIFILAKKSSLSLGVMPASATKDTLENLKDVVLLKLEALPNVLAAGMSNVNMIIHVPTATLNMGLAESNAGKGHFYKDGVSDTVAKVLEKMDRERLRVGEAYGLELMSFVEIVNDFYSLDMKSIRDFVVRTPYHNKVPNDFPKSSRDRYISEDCPYICVPVDALGKIAGLQSTAIESIINIDCIYNDTDYFKEGRNLEKMGLAEMSKEEIIKYVQTGGIPRG